VRPVLKQLAFGLATLAVLPRLAGYRVRRAALGPERAIMGSSQALARIPGVRGRYLRAAFYHRVLAECHPSVAIEWGTLFSQPGARLERNVYIGPGCHVGRAHICHDTLIAAGVHLPSGPETHGIRRLDVPIREQDGNLYTVRIGADCWVGSSAIVLADVGAGTVVAAGAVVTKPLPERVIAAGVPARVIRAREQEQPQAASPGSSAPGRAG
jgi:acetyltransferase-like isoleucine patch superfamily enzyme